jgi:hypothetical protein
MMRRTIFLTLGVLEFVVALVLLYLAWQLPSAADVDHSFAGAGRVTGKAANQVRLLRQQVHDLRRPEVHRLAERLREQTRDVTAALRAQSVDYDSIRTLRDALRDVSGGLDSLARTLDPDGIGKLATGLGETASFLDEQVVPGAEKAAAHLDESTEALRVDARRLGALVREAPLDLKAAREVHDSLARFGEGLERMNTAFQPKRLQALREGFGGMESALTSGAEQVERLSGYSYPVVKFDNLKPVIDQKQFWPEGDKIAEGMRKAATGAREAGKELDDMAADLPRLRDSLAESRKVVDKTREALATALKQHDKVEPLLKDLPAHSARLAEALPKLGADLSRVLRDTRRLKEVATALRQAQHGIADAVACWPELQATLRRSAVALKMIGKQLDQAIQHKQDYEAARQQTVVLADAVGTMLPLVTNQVGDQLADQEKALDELGDSIDEVGAAMPVYAATTARLVQTGRLLLWLVALIVGLHGGYLVCSARMGRRFSP